MITNQEIREAITAVIGAKRQRITRQDVANIVERVLADIGIYTTADHADRIGVIGHHNRNLVLINIENDGYKFLPIRPGQRIEILVDGVWQPARVIVDNDPDAICRQRLDVSDDTPVYGVYARVIRALTAAPVPALPPAEMLLEGGDDKK